MDCERFYFYGDFCPELRLLFEMSREPVPETINAAIGRLHLDELETVPVEVVSVTKSEPKGAFISVDKAPKGYDTSLPSGGPASNKNGFEDLQPYGHNFMQDPNLMTANQGVGQTRMFAPHMMNPFMPYHPMMHMPHSGFFPGGPDQMFPPDSSAAVDFIPAQGIELNLSSRASTDPLSHPNQNSNEPVFWSSGNEGTSSAPMDENPLTDSVKSRQVRDSYVRGSSFAVESSEHDTIPLPGANTTRRQTFHAIPGPTLLEDASTQEPSRSTVGGRNVNSKENPVSGAADLDANSSSKDNEKRIYSQTAAYPYSGTLLQPNPVISGHPLGHHIGSPFPGYGFSSPFSPIPGTPLNNNLNSNIGSPHAAEERNGETTKSSVQNSTLIHAPSSPSVSQNGHPMSRPWLYGPPHGSPNFLVPHHPSHTNSHQSPPGSGVQSRKRNHNSSNNRNFNAKYQGKAQRFDDAARYQDATLDQFIGSIYTLCKDQHGCRFLQKQLDEFGQEAASTIYGEIKAHIFELMNDPFGNYLVQKLFETITSKERLEIVQNYAPQFLQTALDAHGTRALQKLVECIDTEEETHILITALKPSVISLSKDFKSNHVVQKMLEKFSSKDTQFIYDAAVKDIVKIGNHRNGCCVVQRCLDFGTPEQHDALCEKIATKSFDLTLNPYGNYVIQYILTKEKESADSDFKYTHKIVDVLKPNAVELSLNKFSSNVIESILRTPAVSQPIISELLNSSDEQGLSKLLNDSYGNYVLQTALDVLKDTNKSLFDLLAESLKPLLVGQIRNTPHGRRISNLLQLE